MTQGSSCKRGMNDPAVGGAERIHGDGFSLPFGFFAEAQRHIFEGFAPPLAIVFDIDDDMRAFAARAFAGDPADEILQGFECLAFAADQ